MQEAEVTRVRTLKGGVALGADRGHRGDHSVVCEPAILAAVLLDYTQLNTEYFYLLIALMLPFTFLIFPGSEKAPLDRIPWYDLLLFARPSVRRSG